MKRITSALLLLALWLGACTSSPSATQAVSTEPVEAAPAETVPAESAPTENSEQAAAGREAVVSEFENEVSVRTTSESEFIPAEAGFVIQQGGALQTGENGRVRLDLMPEGTIIRIAPNSAFTIPQITETDEEPKTTINLFFGKIFVLLNGGSLDVQTPSGVASVRGSLLSVSYNPANGRGQAVCLEGHCALENKDGEAVELVEGESALIDEEGQVFKFDGIDQDEIEAWLFEAPELGDFLPGTLNPEEYPELEAFYFYDFDPSTYYDQLPTDDGGFYWSFDEGTLPGTDEYENYNTEEAPTDDTGGSPTEEPTQDPNAGGSPTEEPTQDPTGGYPTEEPTQDPNSGGDPTEEPTQDPGG